MNIPPGQNAFTYKPAEVFSKADKREFSYINRGVAGGAKRALQQKGIAVHGLHIKPENAPLKYRKK